MASSAAKATRKAKICVSIAASEISDLKKQVASAIALGADFVEIRFDFFKAGDISVAADAVEAVKGRAVFTLRSKAQGGMFAGTEQERFRLLKALGDRKPMLLDVELDAIRENDDLADYVENAKTSILVSWHDFEKTPPSDELADILTEMRVYSNYVKVVTTAGSVGDSLRLLELYDGAAGLNPVIFAMGEAGVLSRVLCPVAGNAPFTYASLEKAVAPGQLTLRQMKDIYGRIFSGAAEK